jgi:hypothetical protein
MIVLLPVVFAHAPTLQQYLYDMIVPFLTTGGPHATKSTVGVIDMMCTDTESRGILAGAVNKGKIIMLW